jgi:hypothetical protein
MSVKSEKGPCAAHADLARLKRHQFSFLRMAFSNQQHKYTVGGVGGEVYVVIAHNVVVISALR